MTLEARARLDEYAQGERPAGEATAWFATLAIADQVAAIEALAARLAQAGPRPDDLPAAIARAGVEPRATACVVLGRGTVASQTPKLLRLPPDQHGRTFALLLAWLGITATHHR